MADLKLQLQLRVENGQFKVALTDAQGQVKTLGSTSAASGQQMERSFGGARRAISEIGGVAKSVLPVVAAGLVVAFQEATRFRRVLGEVGQVLGGLIGLAAGGITLAGTRTAIREAADFQAAIAQIDKVAGLSRTQLQGVADDIRELTKEIPLTARELSTIGVAAGQLNLASTQYREFIELVAKSASAFDIPAAEAGQYFGQLINNFRLTIPQVRLVGDSVNALADSIANVSERDLLNVAARSASAATLFGLTAQQLNALAASLLSTGAPAEVAATAINSLLRQLGAPEAQAPQFIAALERIGLSVKSLTQSIGVDAQGALRDFLGRLKELDAQGQRDILGALFAGGGDATALASLVQNLDRYDTAVKSVSDSTAYAGSVERAYAKERALAIAQYGLLRNALNSLKEAIGTPFLAGLSAIGRALTSIVNGIADFARAVPLVTQLVVQAVTLVGALTLVRVAVAVLRPLLGGLASVGSAILGPIIAGLRSAAGAGLAFGARLSAIRVLLGAALGGPIGLAVAALFTLAGAWDAVSAATVEYQGVAGTVSEYVTAAFQALGESVSGYLVGEFRLLATSIVDFGRIAKDVGNSVIAAFVTLGRGLGLVAGAIAVGFRSAFEDIGTLVAALAQDVQAAFSGDFSFSRFRAAIAEAGEGIRDEFGTLRGDLARAAEEAGAVDYLGEAGDAIKRQAGEIADATGEILRAPFDAIGNAVAGRVAANRNRGDTAASAVQGGPGGGRALPAGIDAEAMKKAAAESANARKAELAEWLADLAKRADAFDASEQLKREIFAQTLDAQGKESAAALARLEAQHKAHLETLEGDVEGIDLAQKLFDAGKAKIHLDAIKAQVEKLVSDLNERVSIRDRRSQFSTPAERDRLQDENAADVAGTQAQIEAIARQQGADGDAASAFIERAREGVRELSDTIARATEGPIAQLFRDWSEGARAMESAAASWISATADGITELVTSGKANFRDLADSIIKDIIRIQIRAAIAGLVGSIFPSFSRVGQSSASGTGGGSLNFTGLAGGGPVKGPGGPTDDKISARLSNGEYVIRAASVQKFGRQFFDALNGGFAPSTPGRGFAAGGLVGAASGAGSSGGAPIINIVNQGEPMKVQSAQRGRAPDGRDIYNLIVAPQLSQDLGGNGPIAKQIASQFGLSRRPGRAGN